MPEELSRNQSTLRFDVILQYDWPIKQWLLRIRVFLGGKAKSPYFDLFIHWLIKQTTNTYRNHFSSHALLVGFVFSLAYFIRSNPC